MKIISNIYKLKKIGCKLLLGLSRKSFLQLNNDNPSDRLFSSIGMQAISVYNGIDIIFQSKDFENLLLENPDLKEYCYNQICEACILKYDSSELGIDDVSETDEVVDEL